MDTNSAGMQKLDKVTQQMMWWLYNTRDSIQLNKDTFWGMFLWGQLAQSGECPQKSGTSGHLASLSELCDWSAALDGTKEQRVYAFDYLFFRVKDTDTPYCFLSFFFVNNHINWKKKISILLHVKNGIDKSIKILWPLLTCDIIILP